MSRLFLYLSFFFCLQLQAQTRADDLEDFYDKNQKTGIRTLAGKIITPGKYDWLSPLFNKKINSEGLSFFRLNGLFGFVDRNGKEVIPARYKRAFDFSDGWAKVVLGSGDELFIDKTGNEYILNTDYDTSAYYFSEGLLPVKKNGKWGFINKKSKLVIPYQYNAVGYFKNGLAAVSFSGKGKYEPDITPTNYEGKWGFIDASGKLVIPMNFDSRKDFQDDMCVVGKYTEQGRKRMQFGVIDKSGSFIIPANYTELSSSFSDGLMKAAILRNPNNIQQSWGFLNRDNQWIVQPVYDYVENFSEGIALVNTGSKGLSQAGGKWGFVNTKGELLFPLIGCARIVGSGSTFSIKGFAEVQLKDFSNNEADYYKINRKGEKIK